jgi:hypothetical protein
MSNVSPERTGLPFIVWISAKGDAERDVRIRVSRTATAMLCEMALVEIRPSLHLAEGNLPTSNAVAFTDSHCRKHI